jgi:hypothetical protein
VDFDEAGHDDHVARVDHFGAMGRQIRADGLYYATFDQ